MWCAMFPPTELCLWRSMLLRCFWSTLEERTAIVKEKEKDLVGLEKKIAAFDCRGTADPQRDSFPRKVRSTRFPEELAM